VGNGYTQTWTTPVVISGNLSAAMPDICIDSNGVLHSVYNYQPALLRANIYYTKSTDDGLTWSTPVDVAKNITLFAYMPHIVAGSIDTLYLTYDFNLYPSYTKVIYRMFDGTQWRDTLCLTTSQPGAHANFPILDYRHRFYTFWYWNGKSYYRYLENGIWSNTIAMYPNDYSTVFLAGKASHNNDLHCIGGYWLQGGQVGNKVVYFKYINSDDRWTDLTVLNNGNWLGDDNWGIDLDTNDYPGIVWHEQTYNADPLDDSTMYRFYNGSYWPEAEFITHNPDPEQQRIAIDNNNKPHIIDREKMEQGLKIMYYQKINGLWQGELIDSSYIVVSDPEIIHHNNKLYLVYYKCFTHEDCKVLFTSKQITTNVFGLLIADKIKVYPNPFTNYTNFEFNLKQSGKTSLKVYNLNGQLVNTLINCYLPAGQYKITWNGTDNYGKEVMPGQYLIRLQRGKYIMSRMVSYVN